MSDIGRSGLAIIEEARLPRDVSSAWKTYFREHVPKSEEEFRDLPHKPVFRLLEQRFMMGMPCRVAPPRPTRKGVANLNFLIVVEGAGSSY
jgi:hypothetical protein